MNGGLAEAVANCVAIPSGKGYPMHYPVIFNIEHRDRRRSEKPRLRSTPNSAVVHRVISPTDIEKIEIPETAMYRMAIPNRGAHEEPHFQVIPKYFWESRSFLAVL